MGWVRGKRWLKPYSCIKQVFEKGNLIPGILLRTPLPVLQELAQISVGWEEGSPLVMLNWEVRPMCPISQM